MTQAEKWWEIKGRLISKYGTLSAAAAKIKCSQNAIRKAVEGKAPKVLARMEKIL